MHAEGAKSDVKKGIYSIEIIKEEAIQPGHLLVWFDMVSLFKNARMEHIL